ncbi:MAG: DUF2071 domain-containing protein [Thermoanaerobaculia bacterium]
MILETAQTDALFLNWAIPLAALALPPAGLRYDAAQQGGESLAYFSLVLFRQVGLHPRGARWLGISYPQVDARLYVRDAANAASVLLLRQLVPGWVVPMGRLTTGQPFSAALCTFPGGLPRSETPRPADGNDGTATPPGREWRWQVAAGAPLVVVAHPAGGESAARTAEIAFFRERSRTYWRKGRSLHRSEAAPPPAMTLPVDARIERTDWLDHFLPFAPARGWAAPSSAFLVPRVQLAVVSKPARDLAAPTPATAAAG